MLYTKGKLKIILTFVVLFLVISALLLVVYFKGNTSYKVTFDLDGGTLISGSTEQSVIRGQNADPPIAEKSGYYLHSWSASYERITKDVTIKAIWEYDTSPGIIYANDTNKNYSAITGSYEYLQGEVFLGAYHNKKIILEISDNAFKGRSMITKVYMLSGLITIGNSAFADCTSLLEIEIPATVTHIENEAFLNCTALEKITLNDRLIKIGDSAFENCTALKEITIPSTTNKIPANAFSGCSSLETVILSEGITEIGENAFKNCTALKEIVIPSTVKKISANAFEGCSSLEKLTLSEGLTYVGAYAFKDCPSLKEVTLPASIETIYSGVFDGCDELTVTVMHSEGKSYTRWRKTWNGSATVIWPEELGPDGPKLGPDISIIFPSHRYEKLDPSLEGTPSLGSKPSDYKESNDKIILPSIDLNAALGSPVLREGN